MMFSKVILLHLLEVLDVSLEFYKHLWWICDDGDDNDDDDDYGDDAG